MATKYERDLRWRLAHPDKVKEQQRRYRARKKAQRSPKPVLTDEERIARKKAKAAEYNKRYHAREDVKAKDREKSRKLWDARKNDPGFREKDRERKRREYRLKRGLPADAVLVRRVARPKLTPEEIAARKAAREAAKAEKRAKAAEQRAETLAQRAQRQAEQKAASERAKRRAAPVVKQPVAKPPAPVNTNEPLELIELFRKASKGQPPMPYNPRVKKLSVFSLRGAR